MKRSYLILLFTAALSTVLSPCVEAFAYALAQESSPAEKTCCSNKHAVTKEIPAKSGATCCSKPHKAEDEMASQCSNDADESHGQCSSLCHCSCCGHVVTAFYVLTPLLHPSYIVRQVPKYYSPYHFDYTDFIWQPPRWS